MNPRPALDINAISVAYREKPVVRNATLTVPQGAAMGIVGPNGAGKSTLLKAALGLLPTLTGQAQFFGEPLDKVRQRVGYMPQSASVDWDFPATVADVVLMGTYGNLAWGRRPNAASRKAARDALERVGMSEFSHRQIGELSGGQKQRVFLARVLAQQPELLLMDEPFAGIDAASERSIMDVLHGLKNQGVTLVMVHHDLSTLSKYCDHVALINVEVIAHGPLEATMTSENMHRTYGGAMDWFTQGQA